MLSNEKKQLLILFKQLKKQAQPTFSIIADEEPR
jgi:hypothetical protein